MILGLEITIFLRNIWNLKNYFSNKNYIVIKIWLNNISKIVKYYYISIFIMLFIFILIIIYELLKNLPKI